MPDLASFGHVKRVEIGKTGRLNFMQITDAKEDGLKRTLQVVVGANELSDRFSTRLAKMKDTVQLKGFRKGKVPLAHLKKLYGKALMAEIVQQAVRESSVQALEDRKERPALQPEIALPEAESELERVISGESDLAYSMSFEVMPEIKLSDFKELKLERWIADADEADISKTLDDLAERNTSYEPEASRAAAEGDRVQIDFVGKIDGEAFDGGAGQDAHLVLGQGSFIPGFEEALIGAKSSDDRVVKVTFPDDYRVKDLAGKPAEFEVKVKEVAKPLKPEIDDAFAAGLGAENIEKLKELVRNQIAADHAGAAREKLKRELLDALNEVHDFELPPSLVDREFEAVWQHMKSDMEQSGKTFEDQDTTEEEAREKYRELAQRRVRLGLLIGEIGDQNKIDVTQDELRKALMERARNFPGQEKRVYEYYEKTPGALEELRAPIYEEKVIDFVLELVKPSEKTVTKEELYRHLEELSKT